MMMPPSPVSASQLGTTGSASSPSVSALSFLSPTVLISSVFGPLAGPERSNASLSTAGSPSEGVVNGGAPALACSPPAPLIAVDASLGSAHHGSEEMQCRAVSILPKAFMQFSPKLATSPVGLQELWKRMLGTLYALYTHSSHSSLARGLSSAHDAGMLREAIQENVKNLVFVLTATIATPEQRHMLKHYPQFWQLTSELLQPFDFSSLLVGHLTANKLLP
jgi:hypothetical protein